MYRDEPLVHYMILQLTLIAILSIFLPVVGLLVAVPYFTRRLFANAQNLTGEASKIPTVKFSLKLLGIFSAVLLVLVGIRTVSWQHGLEVWISVGLSATVFAYILFSLGQAPPSVRGNNRGNERIQSQEKHNYEVAILGGSAPGLLYIVCKNLFFFDYIRKQWEQNNQLILNNLEKMFSPERLETMLPTISKMQNLLLNGNAAIWMFGIVIGLSIGALIFSKKIEQPKWKFDSVNFPYFLQGGVVIGLILFILNQRVASYNVLAICGFFYLIQGYSLLYFLSRKIFQRNKFLGILILLLPLFSYIILTIISIFGLLDNWVHFRKFATASSGE
jgi:hypothetical protein